MKDRTVYTFVDGHGLGLSAPSIAGHQKFFDGLKLSFLESYHQFIRNLRNKLEHAPKKKNPPKDGALKGKSSIGDTSNVAKKSKKVNAGRQE